MIPNIKYYAELIETTAEGKKTPKYTIVKDAGCYAPMEQLRGKNGAISFYLIENPKDGEGLDTPRYRLQGKNSLNFTGLKACFEFGALSGYAYGYPLDALTYGKNERLNPFYEYSKDGFLFIIYQNDPNSVKITKIELIVLDNAKPLIASYCKMLQQGGFNWPLEKIRKQARFCGYGPHLPKQ